MGLCSGSSENCKTYNSLLSYVVHVGARVDYASRHLQFSVELCRDGSLWTFHTLAL